MGFLAVGNLRIYPPHPPPRTPVKGNQGVALPLDILCRVRSCPLPCSSALHLTSERRPHRVLRPLPASAPRDPPTTLLILGSTVICLNRRSQTITFIILRGCTDSINMERGRRVLPELRRHQHASEDGQLFFCSPGFEQRSSEMPVSPSKEAHLHCFNPPSSSVAVTNAAYIFNCQTVNCTPCSRESPFCTSPVHPAVQHLSPRSPTGRQDGLKSPPQPLPLPPVTPSSPTSLRAQTQWKKGKLLGRGTFGQVYLGFNSESGQMCAIKEVPVISDDSNSRESLRQLSQEINLLSQFSHPNIVQYISSELVEDTLSVYLEYVSGGSIHKLLQEYGAFGEPVIRSYTAQILSGIAYLHGRNTVHRDIKGANILVDPNGEVKLADFGMAKHISSYASIRSFKGSPYWMAPEVIMNGNGYNLSVDIWSLGCTVLEMATCKPPWSQFEGVAAIFKIGNGKDIPDIPDHLSSEAKSFIKSCLQRDPSARPTAFQLMDHPFVRDQVTLKSAKSSMKKDACPFPFDGNYSMVKNDRRESRSVSPLRDHAHGIIAHGSRTPFSHEKQSTPIGMRMNMSLPVSPCSSPRRQHVASNRSCLPSPTHPANSPGGQTYGQSSHYLYQTRPSHHFQDPFLDVSELRIRTPYGSPKG
ncbi:hypothetical protein HPP92_009056 [Vanilla planifolia]|uniref:mitogen-activated protein kinase kinase kinase n=1 Tax=Vanilla planifolia TaxID=51239 RepID=A0A835RD40_VANPL|nr:hypothetical protein HPP92_009056 [Vanilla planifolia]